MKDLIKKPAEILYKKELDALKKWDKYSKPKNWLLSPRAIKAFILGLDEAIELNGEEIQIEKKFYGDDSLIERAIITLAGNRGLMLVGEPGTAKTMLSELLSAAISGISTNTVQGTAGTTDDMIKYTWNYALLLAKGPSKEALVPSPLYMGLERGIITRFEEITRCPSEVQDTLISVMSDKILNIPELGEQGVLLAERGFNIIATANTIDKGVNEMSSALKRRFNFETVKPIRDLSLEVKIIQNQSRLLIEDDGIDFEIDRDVAEILATTFQELREGQTIEGQKIEKPSSVMSTAEAVSVMYQGAMASYYYDKQRLDMDILVQNIVGAVVKENRDDIIKLRNYFNSIVKKRGESEGGFWKEFYGGKRWIK